MFVKGELVLAACAGIGTDHNHINCDCVDWDGKEEASRPTPKGVLSGRS